MKEQKHTVMREVLEITVPERFLAQPVQNKVSEIMKYRLHPALDKLFSEISPPEEIIRIDRLEISLGSINSEKLEEELLSKILKQTREKLAEKIYKSRKGSGLVRSGKIAGGENTSVVSAEQRDLQILLYFLETGQLPWWFSKTPEKNPGAILQQVLDSGEKENLLSILKTLKKPVVRKRFVFQFSDQDVRNFLRSVAKNDFNALENEIRQLQALFSVKGFNQLKFQRIYLEKSIDFISAEESPATDSVATNFLKELVTNYFEKENVEVQEKMLNAVFLKLQNEIQKSSFLKVKKVLTAAISALFELPVNKTAILKSRELSVLFSMPEIRERVLKEEKATMRFKQEESEREKVKNGEPVFEQEVGKLIEKPEENPEPLKKVAPVFKTEIEQIYIGNAGLVILHPFLRYFFDGLGLLTSEQQFQSLENQYKAVHLLQYLVTGSIRNPEYELALNKVLCGMDVAEPVPTEIQLSEVEKEECHGLLSAVLEQWKALKSKNTDALVETFFKREGALSVGRQGWNLKVERNTFDVMLDRLPWPVSIVKLPWNPYFIYVEW